MYKLYQLQIFMPTVIIMFLCGRYFKTYFDICFNYHRCLCKHKINTDQQPSYMINHACVLVQLSCALLCLKFPVVWRHIPYKDACYVLGKYAKNMLKICKTKLTEMLLATGGWNVTVTGFLVPASTLDCSIILLGNKSHIIFITFIVSMINSLAIAAGSGSNVKSPLLCVKNETIFQWLHCKTFFSKVDLMLQISSVLERIDFSGWDTKCVKDRDTDFNGSGVSENWASWCTHSLASYTFISKRYSSKGLNHWTSLIPTLDKQCCIPCSPSKLD